jgi:hypothetical protein
VPNRGGAAAWASAPSCIAGARLGRPSSAALRKNLLSGALARRGRGAHTLHRQKGGVDGA